jgi:5-guanidino-2-oxopentanoate decarboxylase
MSKRSCGESIPFILKEYGVETVFGMPGVHSLEFYRTLEEAGIRHIGVRHEQGAGFMADGYARASGKPGVATLISGPGVTNASTAIGQAYSDSIPVLMLTSVIATSDLGLDRGMLHEIPDQKMTTASITSLSAITYTPDQVAKQIARAFTRFNTQRPRPVHLSIPLDVLDQPAGECVILKNIPKRPGPDLQDINIVADLIKEASSLVVLAGGGAIEADQAIRVLVENTNAIFVSTVAGKGILPESHPQSLGSSLQRVHTCKAIAEADLVIAIGTEISEPDLYVTADAEAEMLTQNY